MANKLRKHRPKGKLHHLVAKVRKDCKQAKKTQAKRKLHQLVAKVRKDGKQAKKTQAKRKIAPAGSKGKERWQTS